jgi:hypothetical protein
VTSFACTALMSSCNVSPSLSSIEIKPVSNAGELFVCVCAREIA